MESAAVCAAAILIFTWTVFCGIKAGRGVSHNLHVKRSNGSYGWSIVAYIISGYQRLLLTQTLQLIVQYIYSNV